MNRIVLFLLAPFAGVSCSLVATDSTRNLSYQNIAISERVWQAITPGITDEQWLLRHIGPPELIETDAKERVFVYSLKEDTVNQTKIFLLYNKKKRESALLQKRVHLQEGKVCAVETVYPVATHVKTTEKIITKPANESGTQNKNGENPYGNEGEDPFEHPWPFNG